MGNIKKGKEDSSVRDKQPQLKVQEPNTSNKAGKSDDTVRAKEEKGSMKNSK